MVYVVEELEAKTHVGPPRNSWRSVPRHSMRLLVSGWVWFGFPTTYAYESWFDPYLTFTAWRRFDIVFNPDV